MIVDIAPEARRVFEDLYADFPDVDERDSQIVEDVLYHLAHNQSFQITLAEGQLVMTTIARKSRPWDK